MMSKMVVGWLWLEMAKTALKTFGDSSGEEDKQFLAGKLQACRYFIDWELGEVEHQAGLLTALDDTCATMQESWF